MTTGQALHIAHLLEEKGVRFEPGLSDGETERVRQRFGLRFPPDLSCFLQTALPVSNGFVDWRKGLMSEAKREKIQARLDWPREGVLFDLRHNDFWFDRWGEKPDMEERIALAERHLRSCPTLIPIYSHRYIPEQPHTAGNPVFSVYQTDIIYYGSDLISYLVHEFGIVLPSEWMSPRSSGTFVEFWSDMIDL